MTQSQADSENSTNPIALAGKIAQRYVAGDGTHPVNPYRTPAQLGELLDLGIGESGCTVDETMVAVEALMNATPRSTSKRFYNQLFGGRDAVSTAGDMLASVVNTSLYTFKAAGPMAMIERIVIERLAHKIGYKTPGAEGVFTPGGSISNLLGMLLARNSAQPGFRNDGAGGKPITCYVSRDAHYSIVKNAGILGMGRKNVRLIPTDERGRLRCDELRGAIEADLSGGCIPGVVLATAGTTVMGSFDPIAEMATIAESFGIWFHVDASFGGSAAMSPTHKHLLDGTERADSVAWNPHKVMGTPLSVAAFITREPERLRRSLDETADYLFQGDDDAYNPGTRSIQCGRRNDALKIWAAWKHHGDDGYRERMDLLMSLARHCADAVGEHPRMALACEPEFVNVCFEVDGKSSREICDTLRARNELLVGHAVVGGRRIIRVPFVNGELTVADVDEMLGLILKVADSLSPGENAEPKHVNQTTGEGCRR